MSNLIQKYSFSELQWRRYYIYKEFPRVKGYFHCDSCSMHWSIYVYNDKRFCMHCADKAVENRLGFKLIKYKA